METSQQLLWQLQQEVKRLREELEVVKKGNFETITCKTWNIVDAEGKERITAFTSRDGIASVQWLDKDGKQRISAATHANGYAGVQWLDKDGKQRIYAATHADGEASVQWLDKDGKTRIAAGMEADGTVGLPTEDLIPPKKP